MRLGLRGATGREVEAENGRTAVTQHEMVSSGPSDTARHQRQGPSTPVPIGCGCLSVHLWFDINGRKQKLSILSENPKTHWRERHSPLSGLLSWINSQPVAAKDDRNQPWGHRGQRNRGGAEDCGQEQWAQAAAEMSESI